MENIGIEPFGENILVLPETTEVTSTTEFKVQIDEEAEKPQRGVILALGDDVIQNKLSVGSRIIFRKYGGTEIIEEEETYIILTPLDILAIDQR